MSSARSPVRAEIRSIVSLAAPVVFVQAGLMLQGVVDTMMLGRVSQAALAAGALGNTVAWGVLGGTMGVLYSLDPLVAQDYGAARHRRVVGHLSRGLVLGTVLAAVAALANWLFAENLDFFRQPEEIVPLSRAYLLALIPGLLPFLWSIALRQTLQAMSVVRPAAIAIVVANLFNVVANYGLVFGHFGLPRLEVLGSALATSASRWVMFFTLLAFGVRDLRARVGGLWAGWRDAMHGASLRAMVKLGAPIALHQASEMWVFGTVGLMMGALGTLEFAAHQVSLQLASMAFMVPLGIGAAAATRVGNAVGREDATGTHRSAWLSLLLGGGVMIGSALAFSIFPRALGRAFTPDVAVLDVVVLLLPIAAMFQLVDGIQVVAAGILRGMADTARPAFLALLGFWAFGLPAAWILAFPLELGPRGLWFGLSAGLGAVAFLLVLRIRSLLRRPLVELRLALEEEAEEVKEVVEEIGSA